jgi:hypothetical protein
MNYCTSEEPINIFSKRIDKGYLLNFDGKMFVGQWVEIQGIFPLQETFSSLLIFRLILLYNSWYTDKKELIQKMQTPTTNTKLLRLSSQDHCVSRGRRFRIPLLLDAAGPAHCSCATIMRVTFDNTKPPSKLQV